MIRRIRELSRATKTLYDKLAALSKSRSAAAGRPGSACCCREVHRRDRRIDRFTTDAQLARLAGAPRSPPAATLRPPPPDPGGNRRLNSAFYMLAIIRIAHDPRTALYFAKQRANAKPNAKRSATSNATSSAASTTFCTTPTPLYEPWGVPVDIMGEVATSALRQTVLGAGVTVGVPAKATTKGEWGLFGVFSRMGDGAHCSE